MQYFSCKVAKHEENIYDKKDNIPLAEQKTQRMTLVKQNQKKESVL